MRRGFLFLSFLLCGSFIFSARVSCASGPTIVPDNARIKAETTWKKADSPFLVKGVVTVDAPLTIEPGVVVKLEYKKGALQINSKFTAAGTAMDRIIFTSSRDDSYGGDTDGDGGANKPAKGDWIGINIGGGWSSGKIRYASILYGGGANWLNAALTINNCENVSLTRSEVKYSYGRGIILIGAPPATIEENVISNNGYCGIYASIGGRTAVIRYNSIFDNAFCGASVYMRQDVIAPPTDRLDARYNWWGDDSGPLYSSAFGWPDNRGGKGNKIYDGVIFDPWLAENKNINPGPDPVIVIPGIMGSWKKDGKWQIDPIFHTYDNLCEEFLANGYEDGKTFSVFPYEWRDSNVKNAKLLRDRINQIKIDTGRPKVDIVAHSMGGLLAREYIESDYYQNDVDQLITVGTPQLGAPKDYVTWEAGEFTGPWGFAFKRIINHEAEENGYSNIFDYIRNRPMDSVRELLPNYNYLFEKKNNYELKKTYPLNYPENNFLDELNNENKTRLLEELEFYNIIGKLNGNQSTISGFNIVDSDDSKIWKHGYPENFWFMLGSRGFVRDSGDGTVPLYSAEATNIPIDKTIYFQSEHNALPTNAQQDILEILTGKRPNKKIDEWKIDDILIGLVFSPIDFQIISPSGKRLGKNFETGGEYNEIPGAYYTGSDTETEFIVIPNPEDGEYQILTQGTGTGDYKIEIAKISENDEKEAEESAATFTGTAEPEKEEELKIEIRNDDVKKVEKLTISEPEKKNIIADQIRTEIGISSSGNVFSVSNSRSRIQKLDTLKSDIRQYFKTNQIKNRKTAAKITKNFSHIRIYLKRYETETKFKKIKIAKTKANQDIEKLTRFINKNSPKYIAEETRANLIEDLNDLRID